MPLQTKPEDLPAAVRFRLEQRECGLQVACETLPKQNSLPYSIQKGSVQFESRDSFKARVVQSGMSPAVAEDAGRSFHATARQLRQLGFTVEMAEKGHDKELKAA